MPRAAAVRIEELWKTYRVHSPGRRSFFLPRSFQEYQALRGVTLEIQEGTVLGIIGRNGAGKSTLFKVLSRITDPTRGRAIVRGRVASLLELGTGFHPELTGRENVFLNAAIHGLPRRETKARLGSIAEFAQLGAFLDEPVKHYSSGMYLRLGFSIAAHLEPDVLLLDEILAVGDAEFQKRCLGRIESLERSGRTVIIVSHNLQLIKEVCHQALWLDAGSLAALGSPDEVVTAYLREPSGEPRKRASDAPTAQAAGQAETGTAGATA